MDNPIYFIGKYLCYLTSRSFVRKITGFENIPRKGRIILASNHGSLLDTISLPTLVDLRLGRQVHYIGKKELFKGRFNNFIMKAVGVIPTDRDAGGKEALKHALKALADGEVIGIFPEGTRSRDGKFGRGRTGIARLALWAQCPVIPVGLDDSYKSWPKGKLPRFKRFDIKVGKPMHFDKYHGKDDPDTLREVTDSIMLEISKLINKPYNKEEYNKR